MKKAVVTGAGGFIGAHLVTYLKQKSYTVFGIDLKKPEYSRSRADKFILGDLRNSVFAQKNITSADELYMFAADMGGVGYIHSVHAKIARNNILINTNCLDAARRNGINTVFFASSACVYPVSKQQDPNSAGLKETDVLPAEPDSMYAWEKLFTEQLCLAYSKDFHLDIHVARFHNVYGPEGTYTGGREKSPAALCRKISLAKSGDAIEIWGDGKQTRSYCYIDDCCEGIYRLMQSSYLDPVNIGSTELISINGLADVIASIAHKKIKKVNNKDKPQGVRGRNSDNTKIRKMLHWEPTTSLADGLRHTYVWIEKEISRRARDMQTDSTVARKKSGISTI